MHASYISQPEKLGARRTPTGLRRTQVTPRLLAFSLVYIGLYLMCYMQTDSPMVAPLNIPVGGPTPSTAAPPSYPPTGKATKTTNFSIDIHLQSPYSANHDQHSTQQSLPCPPRASPPRKRAYLTPMARERERRNVHAVVRRFEIDAALYRGIYLCHAMLSYRHILIPTEEDAFGHYSAIRPLASDSRAQKRRADEAEGRDIMYPRMKCAEVFR